MSFGVKSGPKYQLHKQKKRKISGTRYLCNMTPRTSTPVCTSLKYKSKPDISPILKNKIKKEEDMKYYLDLVDHRFWDKPEVFHEFLNILQEYESGSLDKLSVSIQVNYLFKEHPELIVHFNKLFPSDYEYPFQAYSAPDLTTMHTAALSQPNNIVNPRPQESSFVTDQLHSLQENSQHHVQNISKSFSLRKNATRMCLSTEIILQTMIRLFGRFQIHL